MLISGYRSPATNAMLRSRSSGVAKNSRHLQGEAADLRLASRSVNQMARAARPVDAGGVGRYYGLELRPHGLRPGPRLGQLRTEHSQTDLHSNLAPTGAFFVSGDRTPTETEPGQVFPLS